MLSESTDSTILLSLLPIDSLHITAVKMVDSTRHMSTVASDPCYWLALELVLPCNIGETSNQTSTHVTPDSYMRMSGLHQANWTATAY